MLPVIHYAADLIELALRQKAEDVYDAYQFDEEVKEFCDKWTELFNALDMYGEVYYFTKNTFIENLYLTILTEDNKILIGIDNTGFKELEEKAREFFESILIAKLETLKINPQQLAVLVGSFIKTIKEMFEITHRAPSAREL